MIYLLISLTIIIITNILTYIFTSRNIKKKDIDYVTEEAKKQLVEELTQIQSNNLINHGLQPQTQSTETKKEKKPKKTLWPVQKKV